MSETTRRIQCLSELEASAVYEIVSDIVEITARDGAELVVKGTSTDINSAQLELELCGISATFV